MNASNTLPAWLAWLETLHPKSIDMGLERVRVVAERLGVLHPHVPVVTVGGTNGKGSTTALLEALLLAHGKRVGCYTSPHILEFNERIRVDGAAVTDREIVRVLAEIDTARGDVSLTYFEFTTLAALVLFAEANLDCWVLEVGLGGRLDAVNIIDADVAVITSIGLDHQEWLGNTREAIATEKSGIFRAGKPAVIGDTLPPVPLIDAANALQAPTFLVGDAFAFQSSPDNETWSWRGHVRDGSALALTRLPNPTLALANAATALQAFVLLPFAAEADAVRTALQRVRLPGRNQRVDVGARVVILDVGHNADGMRFLVSELPRHGVGMRFHLVLGMLADKDIEAAVRVLEPFACAWHIAPLPSTRSASAGQLHAALGKAGATEVSVHADIAAALRSALQTSDGLPVLVTGSFYTVAAAMTTLGLEAAT